MKSKGNVLLVVLVAVGILAISVGGYFFYRQKNCVYIQGRCVPPEDWRDALRKEALRSLRTALELYRADGHSYPRFYGNPSEILRILVPKYLVGVPKDSGDRQFYYEYTPENNGYFLCASMEKNLSNTFAPTSCKNKNCGGTCNYEIKSPK